MKALALRSTLLVALLASILTAALPAFAQSFPSKPISIVHASPPGGGLDVQARIVAAAVSPIFGQPVVALSRPGASLTLAATTMLNAPADGHMVMVNMGGLVSEVPHILDAGYDPFNDIVPLAELYNTGLFLVARPDFPANNIEELVALAKEAAPGTYSFGSYGAGTLSHVFGLMLNESAGIELMHVPYKGAPLALQDLVGGHVDLASVGPTPLPGLVEAGRVKLLGFSGEARSPKYPDVPTVAESGYPDVIAKIGVALFGSAKMPVEVRDQWREAVFRALEDEQTIKSMAMSGNVPAEPKSSEEISASLKADYDRMGTFMSQVKSDK